MVEASKPPASGEPLLEFLGVMRRLRSDCAWKAGQTHRSLVRYLLEEAYETVEAIEDGDRTGDWEHLREELGDLLLQVYFHAVIAEESGEFTLDDVAADITAKMRRRNPHVFDASAADPALDAAQVNEAWEAIKATEKQRDSVTEGIPAGLPALLYADKVLDRLGRSVRGSGEVATVPGAGPAAGPPPDEDDPGRELGDRLLALVAESHAAGIDPEQALRDAVRRLL